MKTKLVSFLLTILFSQAFLAQKASAQQTNDESPALRTWYIIGSPIGEVAWQNNLSGLGISVVPFGITDQNSFRFAGYFNTGGFKMIHTIGDWSEQIGSLSGTMADYVFNDPGSTDMQVATPGTYLITIFDDGSSQSMFYERLYNEQPVYSSIGILGDFTSWEDDIKMNRVQGVEHSWYTTLSLNQSTSLKFRADSRWDFNWGNTGFPFGEGYTDGPNIEVKAGNYTVFFNDITGDYLFLDAATGTLPANDGSEGIVDGITQQKAEKPSASIYTLSGRRVTGPLSRGTFIFRSSNGSWRKVLVK